MTEEELKLVISTYQQKCFDLFNQNIVLETQINKLNKDITELKKQIIKLTTNSSSEEDFD